MNMIVCTREEIQPCPWTWTRKVW